MHIMTQANKLSKYCNILFYFKLYCLEKRFSFGLYTVKYCMDGGGKELLVTKIFTITTYDDVAIFSLHHELAHNSTRGWCIYPCVRPG